MGHIGTERVIGIYALETFQLRLSMRLIDEFIPWTVRSNEGFLTMELTVWMALMCKAVGGGGGPEENDHSVERREKEGLGARERRGPSRP